MTPIEKAATSKSFCIYPWIHQYVGPEGEVKPCCIYNPNDIGLGNLKSETLKEVWNNEKTKQIRLDMLNDVEIPGCSLCNKREGITKVPRDSANEVWLEKNKNIVNQTNDDGSLNDHKLKYIDARFNNLCNFKCRTCSPQFSTNWHEDYEKLRNKEHDNKYPKSLLVPGNSEDQLVDEIIPLLSEVNRIYFAGGEPLMQIEHYKILDELLRISHTGSQHKPLLLQYSTNFSNLKLGKYNVLDYWKKFARIYLAASLDGSYEKAEYWRKGTDWNEIVENIKNLRKECPRVMFKINYTLSWVNAFNLLDFHKEWVELEYIKINDISINMLDHESYYSLKTLPKWKKQKIENAFLDHIQWLKTNKAKPEIIDNYLDAIKFMNSTDNEMFMRLDDFKYRTESLDELRNESFWDVYPEHNDIKELIYGPNTL